MEALFNHVISGGIQCTLCPHECLISEGHSGICKVRSNQKGSLIADSYGKLSAIHQDPVEKKPLYHFFPGSTILSIGSVGCNMRCQCCQNWQISQTSTGEYNFSREYTAREVLQIALADGNNLGIAYTYNEPGIWFEFVMDTARMVHDHGLKNVMVSNGFINSEPLRQLLDVIDAFNIDLKGFSETFYRKFTGSGLAPVLRTLQQISNSQSHLEITCLIVPGQNDDPEEFASMINWISGELGDRTILHLSRYHPAYKLGVEPTSETEMQRLLEIASNKLFYVYAGNISMKDFEDTRCCNCSEIVIQRTGYHIRNVGLTDSGLCRNCGNRIIIC